MGWTTKKRWVEVPKKTGYYSKRYITTLYQNKDSRSSTYRKWLKNGMNEKVTFKAPRGEKWNQLNLTARAVYIVIAANVNFETQECNFLSREKIASIVGIKNPDDVSKYTNQLVDFGFISKTVKWVKKDDKRCIYKVLVDKNYSLVKTDIIRSGMTGKQFALFCTIASLRYKHSHRVRATYESCGISAATFNKYISELIDLEAIEKDNDYILFKRFVVCEDYRTNWKIKELLKADETSKEYKMAKYAQEHPKSIDNIDAYIDYAWTGVRRHNNDNNNTNR